MYIIHLKLLIIF